MRISLRELLLLVVVFALGCLALKYANSTWQAALSTAVLVSFMATAIVALIDRGPGQSFALGFAACVLIYVTVIHSQDNTEFDPYQGTLITSRVMLPIYQQITAKVMIDFSTGKVYPQGARSASGSNSNSSTNPPVPAPTVAVPYVPVQPSNVPVPVYAAPPTIVGGPIFGNTELPSRQHFMSVAHSLWALLLGYVGGHFAKFVYARRVATSKSAES